MIPAPSTVPPDAFAAAEAGFDYFTDDAHYQALASRMLSVFRGGHGFVLLIKDPLISIDLLGSALGKAAPRHNIVKITCRPGMSGDEVLRESPSRRPFAASEAMMGPGGLPPGAVPLRQPAPLFILDDADRLSYEQLEQIYDGLQPDDHVTPAVVLLAQEEFRSRLERPALRFLKESLAGDFAFLKLGREEVGPFILRQLRAAGAAHGFPTETVAAIADVSEGDPAVVNRLARLVIDFSTTSGGAVSPPTPRDAPVQDRRKESPLREIRREPPPLPEPPLVAPPLAEARTEALPETPPPLPEPPKLPAPTAAPPAESSADLLTQALRPEPVKPPAEPIAKPTLPLAPPPAAVAPVKPEAPAVELKTAAAANELPKELAVRALKIETPVADPKAGPAAEEPALRLVEDAPKSAASRPTPPPWLRRSRPAAGGEAPEEPARRDRLAGSETPPPALPARAEIPATPTARVEATASPAARAEASASPAGRAEAPASPAARTEASASPESRAEFSVIVRPPPEPAKPVQRDIRAADPPASLPEPPPLPPVAARAAGRRVPVGIVIALLYVVVVGAASVAVFWFLHPAAKSFISSSMRDIGVALDLVHSKPAPLAGPTADAPVETAVGTPPPATTASAPADATAAMPAPDSAAASPTPPSPAPETGAAAPAVAGDAAASAPATIPPQAAPVAEADVTAPPESATGATPPETAVSALPPPSVPAPSALATETPPVAAEAPIAPASNDRRPPAAAPPTDTSLASQLLPPPAAPPPSVTPPAPSAASVAPQIAVAALPPAAKAAAPAPQPSAEIAGLLKRGDDLIAVGDIVSARLFYERAADGGSARAALLAGQTFDPTYLNRVGVLGVRGDPAKAAVWYQRARDLGDAAAQSRLDNLKTSILKTK